MSYSLIIVLKYTKINWLTWKLTHSYACNSTIIVCKFETKIIRYGFDENYFISGFTLYIIRYLC